MSQEILYLHKHAYHVKKGRNKDSKQKTHSNSNITVKGLECNVGVNIYDDTYL